MTQDINLGIVEQVDVPANGGVNIYARPDDPRWITAREHDLHMSIGGACEPLFVGRPHLITFQTYVNEPNGHASTVSVTSRRPDGARVHEPIEGKAA